MTEPLTPSAEMQRILEELESRKTDDEHIVVWDTDRQRFLGYLPRLLSYIRTLEKEHDATKEAAVNLYDNRLGHREDNPQWSAPQYFWKKLGEALSSLTLKP